jgi:hypothetical protein
VEILELGSCSTNAAEMRASTTAWLVAYNQTLGVGHLLMLCHLVVYGLDAWPSLCQMSCALQALVLFDILHAILGLWPPDPHVSMWQRIWCKVGHRSELFVTMALYNRNASTALQSYTFGFMLLTWCMADCARYQLYTLRSLAKPAPPLLAWLRYSDFIVQYPLVIVSEAAFVGACHLGTVGAVSMPFAAVLVSLNARFSRVESALAVSVGAAVMLSFALDGSPCSWYAPIAIGFQVYEWLIFMPAFERLWQVRKRRLVPQEHETRARAAASSGPGSSVARCSVPDLRCSLAAGT